MAKLFFTIAAILCVICPAMSENRRSQIDSINIVLKKTSIQDTNMVNLLNQLSDDYIAADVYDSAIICASQAKDLAQRLRFSSGESMSLRKIGIAYSTQGDYPKALSCLFKSLKISDSTKNNKEIGMCYNSIGIIYGRQKDFNTSLEYLYKSLSFYKNPLVYEDIARVYHLQNKDMMAIEFYNKALSSNIPLIEKSYIFNDIGDIYEQKNNLDSALLYYFNSLEISNKSQDNIGICDAYGSIGDLFLKQKKYKDAIEYENKSLSISQKINYKYSIVQSEKSLSEIYEKLGNSTESLKHYKNYYSLKDSLFNEENTKQTVKSEMNFQFEKKQAIQKVEQDKKDALSKAELNHQQRQRNWVMAGLCLVIVFSIFLFGSYKQTKKQKEIAIEAKKEVEHKNKEITDNINYAQRIQKAMLPSDEYMKNNIPENFLIYKPKDIVSGDFYWCYVDGETKYISTADCTGHGVSGAMMSMIGASLLNEIVIERKITSPEKILDTLRDEIIKSINKEGGDEERKDGMDISICKITGMKLEVACANNPVYIVRNESVIDIKANRFPVGKHINESPFTLNTIELQKNDVIYTLSDGYVDQFSERTGKKLMSKRFKEWICELSSNDMTHIKSELETRFTDWVGNTEQIDDVTVLAVKI